MAHTWNRFNRLVAFAAAIATCLELSSSLAVAEAQGITSGQQQRAPETQITVSKAPRLRTATSGNGVPLPAFVEAEVVVTDTESRPMAGVAVQAVTAGPADYGHAISDSNGKARIVVPLAALSATPAGEIIFIVCRVLRDRECSEPRYMNFRKWIDLQLGVDFLASVSGPGGDGPSAETTSAGFSLFPRVYFYPVQTRHIGLAIIASVPWMHERRRFELLSEPVGDDRGRTDLGVVNEFISGAGDAVGGVSIGVKDVLLLQADYNSRTGKLDPLDPVIRSIVLRRHERLLSVADGFESVGVTARLTLPAGKPRQLLMQASFSSYEPRNLSIEQDFVDARGLLQTARRTFSAANEDGWDASVGMRFRGTTHEGSTFGGYRHEPSMQLTEQAIVVTTTGTRSASTIGIRTLLQILGFRDPQQIQPLRFPGDNQWFWGADVSTVGHVVDGGVRAKMSWGTESGLGATVSAHIDFNLLR